MTASPLAEWQEDAKLVAANLYEQYKAVLAVLMPDGVPFGMEAVPTSDQVAQYVQTVRDDPNAWLAWVRQRTMDIYTHLESQGIGPDAIVGVHPMDIAWKNAYFYADKMEKLTKREEAKND